MKNSKSKSKNNYLFIILLIFIAFFAGALIQQKVPLINKIKHLFLPSKTVKRQELKEILKLDSDLKWQNTQIIKEDVVSQYRRKLVQFKTNNDTTGAYILIPGDTGNGPYPAILCIHGHHSNKEEIVGINNSNYNTQFGYTLVKQGYLVLAPDIYESADFKREDFIALAYITEGRSLTSRRVSDLWRSINYLKEFKIDGKQIVDKNRIGIVGWSMGAGLSLYLSALNPDIKVIYSSCYFNSFEHSILGRRQTTDNYIPGILQFGDMSDVASLISPRPLFLEQAANDPEFPLEYAKLAFSDLQEIYKKDGASDKLAMGVGEGKHRFYAIELIPWFKKHL